MEVWLYYIEPGERMPSLFKRMYLTGGFLSLRTVSPFGLFHRPKWQMSLHFYILQPVKFLPLDCIRKKSPLRGHMLFILLAANRCAWTIQNKKKRDIVYSIHQKKYGGCWISNQGVLLPWMLTRIFTFQRENWNYFIVWTDDDNCCFFSLSLLSWSQHLSTLIYSNTL